MRLRAVVAMDKNRIIWNDGKMPRHEVADLKRFKKLTKGKKCLMWRKTFESLKYYRPDAQWYPYAEENIILSGKMKEEPWISIVHNIAELREKYANEIIYVVWWAGTINSLMQYIDEIYATFVKWNYVWDAQLNEFEETYWFEEYHPQDDENDKYYDERYDENYDKQIESENPNLTFKRYRKKKSISQSTRPSS